jgi:antitoxin HigA-1
MTIKKIMPIHPGEILSEDFIKPLNITQYRLAKDIGVSATRIGQIISGKRSITPETDLRLCAYFELSVGYWLRIQNSYDLEIEKRNLEEKLMEIIPYSKLHKLSHS